MITTLVILLVLLMVYSTIVTLYLMGAIFLLKKARARDSIDRNNFITAITQTLDKAKELKENSHFDA